FVPTAFLGGITGQFYRQFALTIAVATILSAFNSLTLIPAMCALLLQPEGAEKDWFGRLWDRLLGGFFRVFNRVFDRTSHRYGGAVGRLVRRPALALTTYALLLGLIVVGFRPSRRASFRRRTRATSSSRSSSPTGRRSSGPTPSCGERAVSFSRRRASSSRSRSRGSRARRAPTARTRAPSSSARSRGRSGVTGRRPTSSPRPCSGVCPRSRRRASS